MSTPLNILLCHLPSFHKHYNNEKPFRASLTRRSGVSQQMFTVGMRSCAIAVHFHARGFALPLLVTLPFVSQGNSTFFV